MSEEGAVFPIEAATELPSMVGGKALGLREIARAGLPFPPAWAVLPGHSDGALSNVAAALQARGVTRVAVRSSASDEDGNQHSFAGIHDTHLGVPLDRIVETVASVAASAISERAAAYRRQHGLAPASGPCAVVVQAMLDADWAGVAFGRGEGVLVEAVEGLGEVAVNGDATPESIELTRGNGRWRVARRWPRRQTFAVRMAPSGVERVALSGAPPELPEKVALELAAGVAALERTQGKPLDVEWAVRGTEVVFLQARPQTRPLDSGLMPAQVWTRANAREVFPEVTSASSRGGALESLNRMMHTLYRRFGLRVPDSYPFAALVAGRLVFNEEGYNRINDTLGVPRAWGNVVVGGAGAGTNAFVRPNFLKLVRRLDILIRMALFAMGTERRARAHLEMLRSWADALASVPAQTLDDEALIARAHQIVSEFDETLLMVMRVAGAFQSAVTGGAMALAHHPAPAALLARLLDPDLISVSTLQLEDLVELARSFRDWEGGARFLSTITPEHAAREHWRAQVPAAIWSEVERWLERYGHRGPYENDFASPRPKDDLRLLAVALRPMVLAKEAPQTREARRARRRADAESAWREVASQRGWLVQQRVRGPARKLSRLMQLREELRSEMMRVNYVGRLDALEIGRRLVERGRLDAREDIFHLDAGQIARAVREPGFDARSAVAREKARVAAWRRLEVPNRFTSEEVASFQRAGAGKAPTESVLRGTAVSPGEVEGPARILRTPNDEAKMQRGDILVAPATDPGWTPLFARAAGVIVEIGGVMSHSATVAREYGLPCVSNVEGALEKLRDGDLLRVDGTRGTIEVLSRAG